MLLLLGELLLLVHDLLMVELIPDIHRMGISPMVVHCLDNLDKTKWTKKPARGTRWADKSLVWLDLLSMSDASRIELVPLPPRLPRPLA